MSEEETLAALCQQPSGYKPFERMGRRSDPREFVLVLVAEANSNVSELLPPSSHPRLLHLILESWLSFPR